MSIQIVTLPASSGKTTWVVNQVRDAGAEWISRDRVILPSTEQVWDFEARLAKAGGNLGAKVSTLNDLASEIVELSGVYPLLLSEIMQIKILRDVLDGLDLSYYQAIVNKPGFVRLCFGIISELKAGGITPEDFLLAAEGSKRGARLIELGLVYSAYAEKLRQNGWADRAGLVWMAAKALEEKIELCADWGNVFLDGFDDLSPVQLRLISALANRVDCFYLTITGSIESDRRELVHKRFLRLREMLNAYDVQDLNVASWKTYDPANPFAILEKGLFDYRHQAEIALGDQIEMAAVPDREAEVRTALRWVKNKLLTEGIAASDTAILARDLEPYRGLITRIAGEYKIPVRLQGGLPLGENPLIATILKLIGLISQGKEGLVWHEVISVWRSAYLNWSWAADNPQDGYNRGDHLADTKQLEEVARWGKVLQGYSQWEEAFRLLIDQGADPRDLESDAQEVTSGLPRGRRADRLWEKFTEFVGLITPPEMVNARVGHIAWLETLLGGFDPADTLAGGFGVIGEILAGPLEIARRDWKALESLNRIMRDQIWAESMLNSNPIEFSQFAGELEEIIGQSSYQPQERNESAVYCSGCTEARGLTFQAAAVLGLAEGEFPQTIKEDPFLRDEERILLQGKYGLPLRLSVDSAERAYFYETLTRATRNLIITRPRIADNGARWQPSPFWEEVQRVISIEPKTYTARSKIPFNLAANQSELLQTICSGKGINPAIKENSDGEFLDQLQSLERGRDIILERSSRDVTAAGIFDGNLTNRAEIIARFYPEEHVWSPSRLENYQTCPFNYFIGNLLGLEKPVLPEEGMDPRQWGNIFHQVLEELYRQLGEEYSVDDLLQLLPEIANPIFQDAPRKEGFRETAWWKHTQEEILDKLKLSLVMLETIDPSYRFQAAERRFGLGPDKHEPVMISLKDSEVIRLKGIIDRVDFNGQGEIRVIDYKTSGKAGFDNTAVREGKKLQLPLYALVVQEGLKLGQVKEGFYFHLMAAEPSSFKLSSYRDEASRGPGAAMARASEMAWKTVVLIKEGSYPPLVPGNGCPDYCPAVDFCWRYQPRNW